MNFGGDQFELIFRSAWSWPVALGALVTALAAAWWLNRPAWGAMARWERGATLALEMAAVMLIVLWLLNPRMRYATSASEESRVPVMVDRSMSMATADMMEGKARYRVARELLLGKDSTLRQRLEEQAQVEVYTFHDGLSQHGDGQLPEAPDPAGRRTDLAGALEELAGRYADRPPVAAVLISDGADNTGGDAEAAARRLDAPIYTIGMGRRERGEATWRNAGVLEVNAPTRVGRGKEVEARIRLRQSGLGGEPIRVAISENGSTVTAETIQFGAQPEQETTLRFTPEGTGVHTYRVSLEHLSTDRLEADDTAGFSLVVTSDELRVLYVEGRLRWIYKFLRRVLEREETIEADCVIRTGTQQIIQQGTADLGLRGALPDDPEALGRYDVVVLGDIGPEMLGEKQIERLKDYLRGDNRGVLFIGGPELILSGRFRGTGLEAVVPMGLAGAEPSGESEGPWSVEVTPAGRGTQTLGGLTGFFEQIALSRVYPLSDVKASAQTWLEALGEHRRRPLLVTQRFGRGRVAVLASEDLWQAAMVEQTGARQSPTARFWIQMIHWLAQREKATNEGEPALLAWTDQSYYEPGETVVLNAQLRGGEKTDDNQTRTIQARVRIGPKTVATLQMPPPDVMGQSRMEWKPPYDAQYEVELEQPDEHNTRRAEVAFMTGHPFQELEHRRLNEALLRRIAGASDGAYVTPVGMEEVARAIGARRQGRMRMVEQELVDSPWVFVLFCMVAGLDWIIRRRRNLI